MDALEAEQAAATANIPDKEWKFSEILADHKIHARWEKVRQYFFLRESTYDMSNRCNIRCEGCYYYEGDKQFARNNIDQVYEVGANLAANESLHGYRSRPIFQAVSYRSFLE
jgi:sulfatase maturation enzyme AslB (radical SAM superfamily)